VLKGRALGYARLMHEQLVTSTRHWGQEGEIDLPQVTNELTVNIASRVAVVGAGPVGAVAAADEHIRFELRTTDHTALSPGRAIEPQRAVDPSTRRPRSVPGSGAFRGLDLGGRAGRHARRRGPQRLVGHGLDEIPETNYLKTLFCRVL
jgi:hypothetical protein